MPVFSTGVSIAMESGIKAAATLHHAIARDNFSARQFAAFSKRQRRRYKTFHRFVVGCYPPQFRDLFFNPDPPPHFFKAAVTVLAGRWDGPRAMRRQHPPRIGESARAIACASAGPEATHVG